MKYIDTKFYISYFKRINYFFIFTSNNLFKHFKHDKYIYFEANILATLV